MNNASFSDLVKTSSTSFDVRKEVQSFDANYKSGKRSRGDASSGDNGGENNDGETKSTNKKRRYKKGKLITDGSDDETSAKDGSSTKYRDRAKERREEGISSEYKESQALIDKYERARMEDNMGGNAEDMTKYLGGDEEHTHLVKGLDKRLADRVRGEITGERGGKRGGRGVDDDVDDDDALEELLIRGSKGGKKKGVRVPEVRKLCSEYNGGYEVCDGVVRWLRGVYLGGEGGGDGRKTDGKKTEGWRVLELGGKVWGGSREVVRRGGGRAKRRNDGWRRVELGVVEGVGRGLEEGRKAREEKEKRQRKVEEKEERKVVERGEEGGEGEDGEESEDDIYSDIEEEYDGGAPPPEPSASNEEDKPRRRKVGFADDVKAGAPVTVGGTGGVFDGLGTYEVEEPVEGGGLVLPKGPEGGGEREGEGGEEDGGGKSRRERRAMKGGKKKIERDLLGMGTVGGEGKKVRTAEGGVSMKDGGGYGEEMDADFEWRDEEDEEGDDKAKKKKKK
ncbi:hypothetical protein TrCOL_g501 [Triparma columacea]|uniref:RED-like N-terminal domain-containing protein n=1 Tax=Triparma columacea TaxID=722753 RepID=A0A9W7GGQ1_9STRA|nr:hypothetical protein TrCOL_g501 [Triparma columacea]